ncbi:Hsp20/alpha crystallin family protein [Aquibaculum arenosum]|uniref:Hsp20/alpha crystallin family protein n=1 Tax=Aquibaculum arenosum TaxID=3032591 RepID=A0ABT5YIY7_9PROT|nr:Hsp20/alpha crystallin family protein [Fodinicurvata sp. CAU 1616]MDF2094788.1 Hsp20/alpha crystallin family protein [Fodinicurvata sp. CAU 1616]
MTKQSEQSKSPALQRSALPGHPLTSLREQMDRLFDDFLSGGVARPGSFWDTRFGGGLDLQVPSIDLVEEDKELVVTAELPGVDEKDVEITLDQGILSIRGEKKSESEREEGRTRVSERQYGSFERSIALPEDIDEEQVKAHYDKGVLTIRVGRKPDAVRKAKRIPIGS